MRLSFLGNSSCSNMILKKFREKFLYYATIKRTRNRAMLVDFIRCIYQHTYFQSCIRHMCKCNPVLCIYHLSNWRLSRWCLLVIPFRIRLCIHPLFRSRSIPANTWCEWRDLRPSQQINVAHKRTEFSEIPIFGDVTTIQREMDPIGWIVGCKRDVSMVNT